MTIALDFDGTVVDHIYPEIGKIQPNCLNVLNRIVQKKHKIILWTMRSGKELGEAIDFLTELGIPLYGKNTNPSQKYWTISPKVYAEIYIDDAALGAPLDNKGNIDWYIVEKELEKRKII